MTTMIIGKKRKRNGEEDFKVRKFKVRNDVENGLFIRNKVLNIIRVYPKQQNAFEEIDRIHQEYPFTKNLQAHQLLRVFQYQWHESMERHKDYVFENARDVFMRQGRQTRYFVVASYERFYDIYRQLEPVSRCFYEIIQEHSLCWVYFDVERSGNDFTVDENAFLKQLLLLFEKELNQVYGEKFGKIEVNVKNCMVLHNSSNEKFSLHLIIKPFVQKTGKYMVWRNNQHLGLLIKNWIEKLRSAKQGGFLFYGDNCYIDKAVYTKNRAFRLYLSSKAGKNAHLIVSPNNGYNLSTEMYHLDARCNVQRDNQKLVFYNSLVCHIPVIHKSIEIVEMDSENCKYLQSKNSTGPRLKRRTADHSSMCSGCPVDTSDLDSLVMQRIHPDGNIRKVVYHSNSLHLVYYIYGNRYCENIKRHHKSNHIYFVADISKGLIFQKCLDPACTGYTSSPQRIPEEVIQSLLTRLQENYLESVEKNQHGES